MSALNDLEKLLPQTEGFPTGTGITVLRGKVLSKTPQWLKAILLVETGNKKQIRFYGWQKNKEGDYKVRQKFNVSRGYAGVVAEIMLAFDELKP